MTKLKKNREVKIEWTKQLVAQQKQKTERIKKETMLQNDRSQMLELVEAQTRLAEAQLAVLQMRNTIIDSQVTCKDSSSTGYIT